MWTHVLWFLAAAMAAWMAYRSGEAAGSLRSDDTIDALEEQNERLRRQLGKDMEMAQLSYQQLERRYWHVVDRLANAAALFNTTAMVVKGDGRGIPMEPGALIELGEPMSVAEADRLAAQAQREAREREDARIPTKGEADKEEAESFDGLEPVLINDDGAMPVQRLTVAQEGDGSG